MSDPGSSRAVRGASLLILLQVGSRLLTFTANQVLLRFLTASLLGISAQLEVYYLSVLFFARESLRVAIQRQGGGIEEETKRQDDGAAVVDSKASHVGDEKPHKNKPATSTTATTQAAVNISYISIALGLFVALVLGRLYKTTISSSPTLASTPQLVPSLYIYALAAMLELLSEPAFVLMQIRLQFSVRATAEAVATLVRCFTTLGSAVYASRHSIPAGVLPFALGQASYGLALLAVYTWYGLRLSRDVSFSLLPARLPGRRDTVLFYFPRQTIQLAGSMMAQSLVKHLLTQGDTLLVSILSTPEAQGVYALANNYGGLVARLLFQPVEESSRSYFSRLLSSPSPSTTSSPSPSSTTTSPSPSTPQQSKRPPSKAIKQAHHALSSLTHLYLLLTLPILVFGPPLAPLLLSLIAGPSWLRSGAGSCLSAFAYTLPLLALNGIFEAFISSVATKSQVHVQSLFMGLFSLIFAVTGYLTLRVYDMGAVGLVAANGVNMLCRIVWSGGFIRQYFRERGVKDGKREWGGWEGVLPGPVAVGAAVVAGGVVRRLVGEGQGELQGTREVLTLLVKVAGVAVPFWGAVAFSERAFVLQGYRALRGRTSPS